MNKFVNYDQTKSWLIGVAALDITPGQSVFLFGYPHTPRMSTGVNDSLLASAWWVENDTTASLFISCDLILLTKSLTHRVRETLSKQLALPIEAIMISVTHTHSGPVVAPMISNASDPIVPEPDAAYLRELEERLIIVGQQAKENRRPAKLTIANIDSAGLGTNRHDPAGPTFKTWPVFYATAIDASHPFAAMSICAMHPTVLHDDSTVISGDFPGLARVALQENYTSDFVYLHHMGASGNQSPRHVTREKTIHEARRLGDLLAGRIVEGFDKSSKIQPAPIQSHCRSIDLPIRQLPTTQQAQTQRDAARQRLDQLRHEGTDPVVVRSAEVDLFGAEETCTLAEAANNGQLAEAAAACLPAEIQVIWLGDQALVGWPGEIFVEFAMEVKATSPDSHLITMANGELQGYLVTQDAIDRCTYEAGNAIFASPDSGHQLVTATTELLKRHTLNRDIV